MEFHQKEKVWCGKLGNIRKKISKLKSTVQGKEDSKYFEKEKQSL